MSCGETLLIEQRRTPCYGNCSPGSSWTTPARPRCSSFAGVRAARAPSCTGWTASDESVGAR